jgi:hypothetical protein
MKTLKENWEIPCALIIGIIIAILIPSEAGIANRIIIGICVSSILISCAAILNLK